MPVFPQISADLSSRLSKEIRKQLGITLEPTVTSEDFAPVSFALDHAVTIEIHPEWGNEETMSHTTHRAVIKVRSTLREVRSQTKSFRPDQGQWPIQKIISVARSFKNPNRHYTAVASQKSSKREHLLRMAQEEIPYVPSGMYLMRLANGRYRITITELTLPLEPTRQLVRLVDKNTR